MRALRVVKQVYTRKFALFGFIFVVLLSLLIFRQSVAPVRAATVPSGFVEALVASGFSVPTGIEFAPDGRIFVTQQNGVVRVIKDGTLLPTPFVTVSADTTVDRGLMGMAFDPNFAANQYVYLYYSRSGSEVRNRISRFVADGDVALAGSETVILEFEPLAPTSTMNIGGAMRFGADGKLWLGTGDAEVPNFSQQLSNLHGKMLRINPDGTIPTDNPYYSTLTGNNRAIWAFGLRNAFSFSIQPGTNRIFANDVGKDTWEEINEILPSKNYGWPVHEGVANDIRYTDPLYSYAHGIGANVGCAITGGSFYNPAENQFPGEYIGTYFFTDYCSGWIKVLDLNNGNTVFDFASGLNYPVDLEIASDGTLYYLARGNGPGAGAVYKIEYIASQPPSIAQQPENTIVSDGYTARFEVSVSGTTPIQYQWQESGVDIPGANGAVYNTPPLTLADSGKQFRCVATNAFGTITSTDATLTVTSDRPPVATINSPIDGTRFSAGDTITYSATASDPEDGNLPASAFTWWIDLHHNTHTHGFMQPTSGITSGAFTIPTSGHTAHNIWYRIYLKVTDSAGLTHLSYREVFPHTVNLTVQTNPPGLQLEIDDSPQTAPHSTASVVNMTRKLEAPPQQRKDGKIWVFDRWSDGGMATHNISTPASDTTYTAFYRALGPFQQVNGMVVIEAENYDNSISQNSQAWIFRNGLPGFAGTGYMRADPDNNVSYMAPGYSATSPSLSYPVNFTASGTHYVWLRLHAPAAFGDTLHIGLDNTEIPSADKITSAGMPYDNYVWTRRTVDNVDATLNITPGLHTLNLWMAEDGLRVDRILLTTNASYTPTGNGPAESSRVSNPTPTPTPSPAVLKVQYYTGDTIATDSQLRPRFRILNTGSAAVPLSELTLRYWFTPDGTQPLVLDCDYIIIGCSSMTSEFVAVTPARQNASHYVELGFEATGNLPSSGLSITIRIHKADWTAFNESNDYSFDPTKTAFADWSRVTLYRNGMLVWGTEPPTAATNTPTPMLPTNTPTSIVPTNTPGPTATPTATPTSQPVALKVQYYTGDTIATDAQIKPRFRIMGTGGAVPLSELTLRYWFTTEGTGSLVRACDYIIIGCSSMTSEFVTLTPARQNASHYLELGFQATGNLPSSGLSITTRIHKADWTAFNESNDYSFDPTKTAFADWSRVTLYRNGVLVWGTEPTVAP